MAGPAFKVDGLRHPRDDPRGDRAQHGGVAAPGHHQQEFVPAQPRGAVLGPGLIAQDAADMGQHLIARRMSQRVVDRLEMVKVHVQHAKRRPGRAQPIEEQIGRAAVAQAGQRIGQRLFLGL